MSSIKTFLSLILILSAMIFPFKNVAHAVVEKVTATLPPGVNPADPALALSDIRPQTESSPNVLGQTGGGGPDGHCNCSGSAILDSTAANSGNASSESGTAKEGHK